ncbi:hypothetical protein ACS0TY_034623 [Phlomoides rotata]
MKKKLPPFLFLSFTLSLTFSLPLSHTFSFFILINGESLKHHAQHRRTPRNPLAVSTASLRSLPNAAAFGLKSSGRVRCMASYNIKLITPEGEASIECPDSDYILDAAEAGQDLSYSCRVGACSSCLGIVVSGSVDQAD